MKELKKIMKRTLCKLTTFLIISACVFSGEYKNSLISRMSDFRNKVFADVNPGHDVQQKDALREMYEEWDKELNIVYQKIMKDADSVTKNKLRNAQRAWIKFRDSEMENSYYTNNPTGGSMGVLFSLNTAVKLTEERTIQLAEIYDAFDR